jgi:hypothetical protein
MKTTRIPHVPGTPLPELAEFLAPFRVHFHRSEGPQALERYRTGLLTEHPFSPRPDRRRMSLPEVHRQVCDWLRLEAAKELLLRELMSVPERVPA